MLKNKLKNEIGDGDILKIKNSKNENNDITEKKKNKMKKKTQLVGMKGDEFTKLVNERLKKLEKEISNEALKTKRKIKKTGNELIKSVKQKESERSTRVKKKEKLSENTKFVLLYTKNDSEILKRNGFFLGNMMQGNSRVVRCHKKDDKGSVQILACKIILKVQGNNNGIIEKELNLLKKIDHPCVVFVHGVFMTDERYFIFLSSLENKSLDIAIMDGEWILDCNNGSEKYCELGDIKTFIQQSGPIIEKLACFWAAQLISGLDFLHETQQIAHLNLTINHVLVTDNLQLKLTNFRFVKNIDKVLTKLPNWEDYKPSDVIMRLFHLPPEILKKKSFIGRKVDIWSLGIILYHILTAAFPFPNANDMQSLIKCITNEGPSFSNWSDSELAKNAIKNLLQFDPVKRWNLSQLLESQWIKQEKQIPSYITILDEEAKARNKNLDRPRVELAKEEFFKIITNGIGETMEIRKINKNDEVKETVKKLEKTKISTHATTNLSLKTKNEEIISPRQPTVAIKKVAKDKKIMITRKNSDNSKKQNVTNIKNLTSSVVQMKK